MVVDLFVEWARDQAVELSIPRQDTDYDDLGFISDVIGRKRVVADRGERVGGAVRR